MLMGVLDTSFWELNPRKLKPYIEADRLKRKQSNFDAWLNGLYVNQAVAVVIGNALSKKSSKAIKYPEEPFEIFPPTEEELAERAEIERQKVIDFFNGMAVKAGKESI